MRGPGRKGNKWGREGCLPFWTKERLFLDPVKFVSFSNLPLQCSEIARGRSLKRCSRQASSCSETIRRCGSAGAAFYLSHFHIINVIPQSGILPAVYCLWVTCGDRCPLAAEVALLETLHSIISDFVLLCNLSSFVALPRSRAWRRMWLHAWWRNQIKWTWETEEDGKGLYGVQHNLWSCSCPAVESGTLLLLEQVPTPTAQLVALLRLGTVMSWCDSCQGA